MYCQNCGVALSDSANFCLNCGAPVSRTPSPAAPPQPVIQPYLPSPDQPAPPSFPPSMGATTFLGGPPQVQYAGFWLRFVASILDSFVLSFGTLFVFFFIGIFLGVFFAASGDKMDFENPALEIPIGIAAVLSWVGMRWLYFAKCESSSWQATLGKKILGLKVTDLEGRRISFARASGRFFAKFISMLFLYVGYIMVGFTEKKQALHDMFADCLVLRS